jgi:hypothetical protein
MELKKVSTGSLEFDCRTAGFRGIEDRRRHIRILKENPIPYGKLDPQQSL